MNDDFAQLGYFSRLFQEWLIDDVTNDVICLQDYDKSNLQVITNRMRGHLPIFRAMILCWHISGRKGGEKSSKGKNIVTKIFARQIVYNSRV